MKILLTGGGTGGHIFPLMAVAREIKHKNPQHSFVFIGSAFGYKDIFEKNQIQCHNIITGKIRRHFSFWNIIDIPLILIGLIQSYFLVLWHKPNVVFSKGGYGAFSVVLISWIFKIKIVSHESDSIIGFSNKIIFKLSNDVLMSFLCDGYNAKLVGNPVYDFSKAPKDDVLKLNSKKPVLFFMGGSQGAVQLNKLVFAILDKLLEKYEVVHQVGGNNEKDLRDKANKENYHFYGFMNENQIHNVYFKCDLVISRAGSGSIFEIALSEKPSILIPLDSAAGDHQRKNASIYKSSGACVVVDAKEITSDILYEEIEKIMNNKEKIAKLKKSAKEFSKPNAAAEISDIILQYDKEE